ncbi:MAG: serine hydrolase [Micropepsaceae bacterium]
MTIPISRRQLLSLAMASALIPSAARADTVGALPFDVANLGAPDHDLERKVSELAQAAGLARVGFAAVDLVKGRTAFLREGELFPMQSLSHLPIAVAYMQMVEQGSANLNKIVRLSDADISPGRSPLAKRLRAKSTNFTARQLIEHMLLNGDNTATDALLKLGGGPELFQAELKKIGGLEGLRIDRYERVRQAEAVGLSPSTDYADAAKFDAAIMGLGEDKQKQAIDRFLRDPRDTTSPRAIVSLYFKMMSGHLLELQHTAFLLELMRRSKTGADRLNAGMLPGWTLAHRGGQSRTIQGAIAAFNDSGLATYKSGTRKIAIVVFVEGATLGATELARFQSAVARLVLGSWA